VAVVVEATQALVLLHLEPFLFHAMIYVQMVRNPFVDKDLSLRKGDAIFERSLKKSKNHEH
jgi:hypothetical protein